MLIKKSQFLTSITYIKNKPQKHLDEVLFVGKSNVGKSSLINSLANNKKLAYTSSKPGLTKFLNYYLINDSFYFVDCPGYGFSSKKDKDYLHYGNLVEEYFKDNKELKLILFLLDSRHEPTLDDRDFFNFITKTNYNYALVMTKCDKLNQSMKSKILANLKTAFIDLEDTDVLLSSINDKFLISCLENYIMSFVGGKKSEN